MGAKHKSKRSKAMSKNFAATYTARKAKREALADGMPLHVADAIAKTVRDDINRTKLAGTGAFTAQELGTAIYDVLERFAARPWRIVEVPPKGRSSLYLDVVDSAGRVIVGRFGYFYRAQLRAIVTAVNAATPTSAAFIDALRTTLLAEGKS